jgi:hypothetical protein
MPYLRGLCVKARRYTPRKIPFDHTTALRRPGSVANLCELLIAASQPVQLSCIFPSNFGAGIQDLAKKLEPSKHLVKEPKLQPVSLIRKEPAVFISLSFNYRRRRILKRCFR